MVLIKVLIFKKKSTNDKKEAKLSIMQRNKLKRVDS